jgi:hypothetical protein
MMRQLAFVHELGENAFRRGRAADVAHADEQDFDFFGGHIQSEADGYVEVK